MKTVRIVAATAALSFAAGAGAMWAQQQAQQAASRREPQFENEYMTAWKSIVMPGAPMSLHRHDHGRALISLNGGVLKVEDKDRKVLDTYRLTAGKAMWLGKDPPGQMHYDVNDGTKPIEVIVVQLKNDTSR